MEWATADWVVSLEAKSSGYDLNSAGQAEHKLDLEISMTPNRELMRTSNASPASVMGFLSV
jgi:hypothetical protein